MTPCLVRERWGFVFQGNSEILGMVFEGAANLGTLNDESVLANS